MRTMTEHALRWVLVALGLALAADTALLASALAQTYGGVGPSAVALPTLLWVALLFACAIPAYLGFRSLRTGRPDSRAAAAAGGRRGAMFFILGATSAVLYTATGLILGFVYVPTGAYTGTPPSPIPVALGEAIRGVHAVAPAAIAVFAGLFLLRSIWSLAPSRSKALAAVAFLAGAAAPGVGLSSLYLAFPGLTAGGALALDGLPVVSLALWIAVYLLVLRRVRGSTSSTVSTATLA